MTELQYLPDADDVLEFTATVTEATTEYIVLDGTYFYPEGGGQPPDSGRFEWEGGSAMVHDVQKDHGEAKHYVDDMTSEPPLVGTKIAGYLDEERRETLSRMHTAQHVISRVVLDEFGAKTAGNQIHPARSRIDFSPVTFDAGDVERIESLTNAAIERDFSVVKENRPRTLVEEQVDANRSLLHLIPDSVDPLRVVEIESFDLCPCGGTHVNDLSEIGGIEITNRVSKGADVDRLEFTLTA